MRGVNLCAHEEQGEQIQAAHWYLLPVVEWIADNWNALFHEQRLPVPDADGAAATAARALSLLEASPDRSPAGWGLASVDTDDRLVQYQDWAGRHRLASAASEGPLPEVWLRRTGGDVEVSLGEGRAELFDGELSWTAPPRTATVPVVEAARVTERAVRALLDELSERGACAARAGQALSRLDAVVSPAADDERLAWLVGLRGDTSALAVLRASLDELDPSAANPPGTGGAAVLTAVPVATLFGSLSPAVDHEDLQELVRALRASSRPDGLLARLDGLAAAADRADVVGLPEGQAGGELGDAVAALLPREDDQVPITRFIEEDLGLTITSVRLSDSSIRAVTLLHEDGRAAIAVNAAYERGTARHVVRFTLAHELAHLVFDRAAAGRLAIASGPWTPARVERRANGFAAGLLMPEALLRLHTSREEGWPTEPPTLARIAGRLGVGITTLAERLQNVGMLSRAAADALVDALLQP
ncbi:MAG: ImmA/IrrE family metallo-endopeptidase [Mycobacteriales bacterium]